MRLLALLPLLVLAGCAGCEEADPSGLAGAVTVDGSSTVFPLAEAVAEEFMRDHSGVRITVGASGTGGGFDKFARGETDASNASRVVKAEELERLRASGVRFIEIPVAYDGIAVVTHPASDWVECLTTDELRRIWEPESAVETWADVRAGFPAVPIALYGPGTDSGTYDYFTEAITGEEGASRTDYTASEADNVLVQGVSGEEGSLAFFGLAYVAENPDRLKVLGVDSGDGCVVPTPQTVQSGEYAPLARVEFVYVNAAEADRNEALDAYVRFFLRMAGPLATEVGAVPLSDEAYRLATERYHSRATGSLFAGRVGTRVVDVLTTATESAALRAATR
ncbi:PstS family phosphate ABC transporter substrate-binding protein [Rubrivirga marina]|uniref:Phosphate-binding protein n=1 Tax=Rubrivirga marina TaxID=1196024 RepID=A0A271J1I2_9BACT|nr:PstS family phosphate ABC transporter substrate-binding protein [Rubrivirga marina]PAP77108.1 protein sphX [Rubrivirga marina]